MVDISVYFPYNFLREAKAVCHSLYFSCCAQIRSVINFITTVKLSNSKTKLYIIGTVLENKYKIFDKLKKKNVIVCK